MNLGSNRLALAFFGEMIHPKPVEEAFSEKDTLTLLILGVDANYSGYHGKASFENSRSDVMIVARFDFKNNRVFAISIPRDTYVEIPGRRRRSKVNGANAIGGADLARRTVEGIINAPIDHVVALNFLGFAQIVDQMGGVYVDVDKSMNYDDNAGRLHIHLKEGKQWLNGDQAMGFVRYRHTDSDFYRAMRHQRFMLAVQEQMKRQSAGSLLEIARVVDANVTGLRPEQFASLVLWAKKLKPGSVKACTLPTRYIGSQDFEPNTEELARVMEKVGWSRGTGLATNGTATDPQGG